MSVAKLVRREPKLVIEESEDGRYVLYESHLASVAHLLKALRLIADCTPIPGPGFSLVLSMTSIAQRALADSQAQRDSKL
jgi:hypothetical protein